MSRTLTETLIQRQLNHWSSLREFLQEKSVAVEAKSKGPVITVSRLIGCGGRTLAETLATRLDLELQDRSLMERIIKDKELEQSLLQQLDEAAISQSDLWVRGVLNQKIFLKDQFHAALVQTVTRLAARGNVVFLGRGANLILQRKATLRVRVVGSWNNRLEHLRDRLEISRAEARSLIEQTDRRREEFIRKLFKNDPGQPQNFDLTINTDRLGIEAATEMVISAMLERQSNGNSEIESGLPPKASKAEG